MHRPPPNPLFFRIQDQFHASKTQTSPLVIAAGPYTTYLDPNDPAHYANYAVPNVQAPETVSGGIDALIDSFVRYDRRPRLEYIETCAPGLEKALIERGFQTESRSVLMVCTQTSLRLPPPVPDVTLARLEPDGDLESYRQVKTIEQRSFWREDAPEGTLEEAEESRRRFGRMPRVIALYDGRIVSTGVLTFESNGIAEAAGIATLPAYRRRGIAGAVTARLAELGFRSGLEAVFLTAIDEAAGRVYSRVGFELTGTVQINISMPEN